jgi:DNA invertase Pin-like site-specific DNA recombinase
MKKAIIYTRFSPRRNADDSESCENQVHLCREYAEKNDLNVIAVINDPDVSGADEYRAKLWEAITLLHKGYCLLVYKRDRLARNVYLSEQINRAVRKKGGVIVAVSGDVAGEGAEINLIRQVLASVAEYERKMISMRTSHAMRAHQERGRKMSKHCPYGFCDDPKQPGFMIENEKEQEAIAMIRKLHMDDGCTCNSIMLQMNELLPDAARGKKWYTKTIFQIIERL